MEIIKTPIIAKPRELTARWTVEYDTNMMFVKELLIRKGYHGEWAIDVPPGQWHNVIIWCATAFGIDGNKRIYRWRKSNLPDKFRIFLRHEEDLTLFKLKWYGN